jgi:hypothetical protein
MACRSLTSPVLRKMVNGLRTMLTAAGVDTDDIRIEEFSGYLLRIAGPQGSCGFPQRQEHAFVSQWNTMPTLSPKFSAILKGAPLFAALTDTEIESLAARAVVRSYSAGESLFFPDRD